MQSVPLGVFHQSGRMIKPHRLLIQDRGGEGREYSGSLPMSLQPPRDKRASLADAVALVSDGAMVALGGGLSARLPMAMVRELIRQGRRGLHLVGSAHSIDVDMLVGAGAGLIFKGTGFYITDYKNKQHPEKSGGETAKPAPAKDAPKPAAAAV